MVKFGDKIYLAKDNVPADVELDNSNYWEIFIDNNDYKTLAAEIGELSDLETEAKDNLVAAINEAKNSAVQPDWEQNDEAAKDYIKNRPFYEESSTENLGTTFADWQKSCQNHGESSIVINANVAGVDYQDVSGSLDGNGHYVNYYFGENYDYRIQVDRGMAQVTIRPADTPFYFYNVYSTIKQIESKYIPFVQPDWEEQNVESAAYIKNKPDYYTDESVNIKVNNGEYSLKPYSYPGMGNITMRFLT